MERKTPQSRKDLLYIYDRLKDLYTSLFQEAEKRSDRYKYAEQIAILYIKQGNMCAGEEKRKQYQEALTLYEDLARGCPDNEKYIQMRDKLKAALG